MVSFMIEVKKVTNLLGGNKVFHCVINSDMQFVNAINKGFPIDSLERLITLHLLSVNEVTHLVISPRTLARRKKTHRLSPEESDRLARVARIISYAQEVMGDDEKANQWLRRPNRALDNRLPLDLLQTESGARIVETILGRIEHGVYS
jgi:putative toxin-antitoxin system antitoxin component (TIGR02293 family)